MANNSSTFPYLCIDPPNHAMMDRTVVVQVIFAAILIMSAFVVFVWWFLRFRSPSTGLTRDENFGDIEMRSINPMTRDNIPSFTFKPTSSLRFQEPICVVCQHDLKMLIGAEPGVPSPLRLAKEVVVLVWHATMACLG